MKSSTRSKAKQSSARKRTRRVPIDEIVPESDYEDKPKKKCKPKGKQRSREDLVHSSVWFNQSIADDLWMPESTELEAVIKPCRQCKIKRKSRQHRKHWDRGKLGRHWSRKQRGMQQPSKHPHIRERVPDNQRMLELLLTSWFEVSNFIDQPRRQQWRTPSMPPARATRAIVEELRELGALVEDDDGSVNSVIKLRLYPTSVQKEKLDQMFAANRAVYNKLVAHSAEDRKTRLAAKVDRISWAEFEHKYRPIARLRHISKYFRNKRVLQRHKAVNDEVRDSAFRDFIKATKASIAGFFAAKSRNEKMTFPEMRFKSKFAPSNTIEIAKRFISRVQRDGNECVRFNPKFFDFNKGDGIFIHEDLPEVTMSVRLQRLREGVYFLIVPRLRQFDKSSSERVCAIDPGVRNLATVYDPDGRTFSVTDSKSIMMNKFKAIDQMKSLLKRMDNASKVKHQDRKRIKNKRGRTSSKTEEGWLRYRLRRRIWFTSRKATRAITDLHQKLSSWLSASYYNVLLP